MVDLAAWLLIALLAAIVAIHHRLVRMLWFRMEDPRPVALLRIATGSLLLAWIVDLAPLWDYLWSNEGLLTGAQAQARFGARRPLSLLYAVDSPSFVRGYVAVLIISCAAFTVGLLTRWTKWITLMSLLGLLARNAIVLGGEQVFTSFLFYLCLARCGQAYGIDAWLRSRRDPGASPRSIPAWPRNLMILHAVPMFFINGMAKYGPSWSTGDTVYYLIHHPAFGPGPVWEPSAWLGPWPLRVLTWGAHAFELLMPLVIVGLVVRLVQANPVPPPSRSTRRVARGLQVVLGADIVALCMLGLPPAARGSLPFIIGITLGAAIAAGPEVLGLARRVPPRVLAWILGRRVWATVWIGFAGTLFFVMELGWFTGLTLCAVVVLFDGPELARRASVSPSPASPYAPAPWRARAIAVLCATQVIAIAAVSLPAVRPPARWRATIERPLRLWIATTTSFQVWRMFAPTASQTVTDLDVEVVDTSGNVHAIGSGLVDPSTRSSTWGLDKREKVRQRLASARQGKRYWSAHVGFVCRHAAPAGVEPQAVRLYRIQTLTPRPEALSRYGVTQALARREQTRTRRLLYEQDCPGAPDPTDASP